MLTFRVQGQIYYHAGSLLPLPDADHKLLQIYFMANTDEQIAQRCHYNAGTRREIVGALQGLFDQHNELVRLFKTAIQRMPADDYAVVIRADKRPVGQHERQFNAPTIDEVAIVIVGEEFESRDIILHRRSGDIQRVSETHRSYDGLQYPILFWRGDDGYHFNIKMIKSTNRECFYLRLLLINIHGPISFQDLRTVNGQLCATYRQACQELNLLENDAHWDTALADASNTARPQQIRTLFAIILTTYFPSNPKDLWEKYKDYMSEDILHRLRYESKNPDIQFTPNVYNEALILIEDICLTIATGNA
ncbi:ATP-dependent DNA helicase [Trichonephila clavipes]|nr:ATP-dependent DNA helicase [Trichonephila clavipes]